MVYFFTLKKKKKTMYSSYCSKNKLTCQCWIFFGILIKNKKIQGVKAPIYCERNGRTNWCGDHCDVISSKIRPKQSLFEFHSGIRNNLPKETFWKRLLQLVHIFKLAVVWGDYVVGRCALGLCFL